MNRLKLNALSSSSNGLFPAANFKKPSITSLLGPSTVKSFSYQFDIRFPLSIKAGASFGSGRCGSLLSANRREMEVEARQVLEHQAPTDSVSPPAHNHERVEEPRYLEVAPEFVAVPHLPEL